MKNKTNNNEELINALDIIEKKRISVKKCFLKQ